MTVTVTRLEKKNAFVAVIVVMASGENHDVRELMIPGESLDKERFSSLPCRITEEELEELFVLEECYHAYEAGMRLLAYGDNSSADLNRKLRAKKYSAHAAETAVRMLKTRGYINDIALLNEKVLYYANEKLHGRRKIIAELTAKGFSRRDVERTIERCSGAIDFYRNQRKLIEQRFGKKDVRTREDIVKIKAFLYRNGY